MNDLGKPMMFDHPTSAPEMKEKKHYPSVYLPMEVLGEKKVNLGDKVTLHFNAEVSALREDEYSREVTFKLIEGEVNEEEKKSE